MKPVVVSCNYCGNAITERHDLMVAALWGVVPRKYHRICYAEREKEIGYQLFYQQFPVNYGLGNLWAFLSPLLAFLLGMAGWRFGIWVALILIVLGAWPGIIRLIAYWKWERHLLPH